MTHRLFGICIGVAASLLAAFAPPSHRSTKLPRPAGVAFRQDPAPTSLPSAEAKRVIADRARRVIAALKAGNTKTLATFVHPRKGVRFSPYANVNSGDRIFQRKQIPGLWGSRKRYLWGTYDPSNEPIDVTFKDYRRRFIYDRDFARATRIAYNGEIMGTAQR